MEGTKRLTPLAIGVAALVGALTATQTGVNLSLATRAVAALPPGSAPDVPAAACVSFAGGWLLLALLNAAADARALRADRRAGADMGADLSLIHI